MSGSFFHLDKVHENGDSSRTMRPRTKIKPVLETRDLWLSAEYQENKNTPSFRVRIRPRKKKNLQNANCLRQILDRDNVP